MKSVHVLLQTRAYEIRLSVLLASSFKNPSPTPQSSLVVGWLCPWLWALPTRFHCEQRFLSLPSTKETESSPPLAAFFEKQNEVDWEFFSQSALFQFLISEERRASFPPRIS